MGDARIHYNEDPFATPPDKRTAIRRLRGRLASGVTVWTASGDEGPVGLTVSSLIVADGDPGQIAAYINDTTDVYEAIVSSNRFVVHILEDQADRLADRFAGLFPAPGGMFADLKVAGNEWGPVLTDLENRAHCSFLSAEPAGYHQLVRATVDEIHLADLDAPLVYFRGGYRRLARPT